ncbi:expressed unknown protein [Seminavis robusta]|uniref:BTB domain-containing protein n=1 Tax=Seminavis robusta TaxID=568900 RepID=A0A9N8H746_9STRA|nr:expressed unknown protein [Seminavis robusta]|eukprot:Sro191_g082240.1 n/a (352) ;mRNA; r:47781-48836
MAETNRDRGVEEEQVADEPPCKKIRSSDPDIKITLKYMDDDNDPATKEYSMYGPVLSHLSKFIDTSLSVGMQEKATNEIIFHDVHPDLFEKALNFLQEPCAARSMTAKDASELIEFYDKYDFEGGLKLCDEVIAAYLEHQNALGLMTPPDDLGILVDAAALAYQINLPKAKDVAISYLRTRMRDAEKTYGRMMFGSEHIKKLQPMFVDRIFREYFLEDLTKEEVSSPLFPKYFLTCTELNHYETQPFEILHLSGTKHAAFNGAYQRDEFSQYPYTKVETVYWNGQLKFVNVDKVADCTWAILAGNVEGDLQSQEVLWKCPYSNRFRAPPIGPWIAVDPTVQEAGSPNICFS